MATSVGHKCTSWKVVLKAPGRTSPCCGAPLRGLKQLKHALEGTQDFFSRCRGGRKVKEKRQEGKAQRLT